MNHSYINPHTIMGMISKNYSLIPNGYRKNKNNIVLFNPFDNYKDYPKENVYINYLLQDEYNSLIAQNIPHNKSRGKQLISNIDKNFINLPGQNFQEIRETRNKYNKITTIKTSPNSIEEVNALIDIWDEKRGDKYGWQRHSGYDRNFFNKYFNQEKDQLFSYFFYIDNVLVGYSIVSKLGNGDRFNYVIRKNNTSFRNLCLYIDFKTFELMYNEINSNFLINWGSSSGTVMKYKKKFPVYEENVVYFCKILKEINEKK
jgi:hypothetical protein